MIIGLLAKKRHGKDTIADYLVEHHGFRKLHFADPLKNICKELYKFSDEQLNGNLKDVVIVEHCNRGVIGRTPRSFFKDHGMEQRNKLGEDFWIEHMKGRMENGNIAIADVRFQNEVNAIKEWGGIVIKIVRDLDNDDFHQSEVEIDRVDNYDYEVFNDGTIEELYEKIENILGEL